MKKKKFVIKKRKLLWGQCDPKLLKKLKVTLLDVIDLDKIWTVNSTLERQLWGLLGGVSQESDKVI